MAEVSKFKVVLQHSEENLLMGDHSKSSLFIFSLAQKLVNVHTNKDSILVMLRCVKMTKADNRCKSCDTYLRDVLYYF